MGGRLPRWTARCRRNTYLILTAHSCFFLFREALLCHSKSRSAAQRTLDAAARMARRTEELLFSSSGRRRHSQPWRQGRAACADRPTFSLSRDIVFSACPLKDFLEIKTENVCAG